MSTSKSNPKGYYKSWYANNRTVLSDNRKHRYSSDPEYRAKAIKRAQVYRERNRSENTPEHILSMLPTGVVADRLHMTSQKLRIWHLRGYFPDPEIWNKRLYFTPEQVRLLRRLARFIAAHKTKIVRSKLEDFDKLRAEIASQWDN